MSKKGKVYLVGAGPGRVDLITIRGAELINESFPEFEPTLRTLGAGLAKEP